MEKVPFGAKVFFCETRAKKEVNFLGFFKKTLAAKTPLWYNK